MKLEELLTIVARGCIHGNPAVEFSGLSTDSRTTGAGDLFVCVRGLTVDGHAFAPTAVEKGAVALVVERELPLEVPQFVVPDARYAGALIARQFYGNPSRQMKVIGVTGTNGKTTTTMIIERILEEAGFRTGLMGTVHLKIGNTVEAAKNTTADAHTLQHTMRRMQEAKSDYCVMEVSSHALDQGRVIGVDFRTAVFTNLTQDHLDYHVTMEAYAAAKGLFFARLGNAAEPGERGRKFAVLNVDDPAHKQYLALTAAEPITYGIDREADVRATDLLLTAQGTRFTLHTFAGTTEVSLKLLGKFNIYNSLGAAAATLAEGIPLATVRAALERIPGVEGRVERVEAGQPFAVLVDYAHTPDGLMNVLDTVREFAAGRIITVFGCGGDRDRAKRPIMGKIAAERSGYTIVTSDNPRSESPESILLEVEKGVIEAGSSTSDYELIADRRMAIQKAVEMAKAEDVVLIAGKGHETYQIIGEAKLPFDDRAVAREAIRSVLG